MLLKKLPSLFEPDHLGQLKEVVVGPDIQILGVVDEWQHVGLHLVDVCGREAIVQFLKERLFGDVLLVELQGSLAQVKEVERGIMSDVPFKIVPVTTLDAVLPSSINQGVHLACKEVGKGEAASHEGLWEQK